MANHGTPLPIGHFAKLAGVTTANLPREMEDSQLALDLAKNGDAVEIILAEALTRTNLERALAKLGKVAKKALDILRFVQTIILPARAEKLDPQKVFTTDSTTIDFGYIDPNFINDFGDMVQEPTTEIVLRQYVLGRQSRFDAAVEEIVGEGFVAETTPGMLYSLLELQPKGPKSANGSLLANGYANLFKMVNKKGVARLVYVYWDDVDAGWSVYSIGASFSIQWSVVHRVFSRNSRLPLAA